MVLCVRLSGRAFSFFRAGTGYAASPSSCGWPGKVVFFLAAWLVCFGGAQTLASQSSRPNTGAAPPSSAVTVHGQLYAPDGSPLQRSVRIQLTSSDTQRAPEYVFSDSCGRFTLSRLLPQESYILTIEGDAKTWRTTVFHFVVTGDRAAQVHVQLNSPERTILSARSTVTVATLARKIPSAARKQFEAGVKQLARGNPAGAMVRLERAIVLFPEYSAAHNEIAVQLMKAGNLAHAEEHLHLALQTDPAAPRPLFNLGLCLQRQGHYADSQPFLEKAAQLQPDSPSGLLLLGIGYLMTGDSARAEPQLLRAYQLGGASVARAQLLLSQLYAGRKEFARAALALETYLRDVPHAPDGPELQSVLLQLRAAAQR